jgi:thiamine pyrophosphokinase
MVHAIRDTGNVILTGRWYHILKNDPERHDPQMHSIIFAGGTVRPGKAVRDALKTADLVIAADSGASTARQYGYHPALIVGDMDSLQEPLQSFLDQGSRLIRAESEKDETDTELAIQSALEMGASQITLLGALGGERIEHAIANIFLLVSSPPSGSGKSAAPSAPEKDLYTQNSKNSSSPELTDAFTVPIFIVDGPSRCWIVQGPGKTEIVGKQGDYLSLFPMTMDARGIFTQGLYYPLQGSTLRFGRARGVSNVLTEERAEVALEDGILLVVYTMRGETDE